MVSTDVIFCEKISETGELDKEANSNTRLLIHWNTDNQRGVFISVSSRNELYQLSKWIHVFGCTFTVIFCG